MSRTLRIPSQLDRIQGASRELQEFLEREDWDSDSLFAVRLAVDEALTNAMKHGNGEDPSKKIYLEFSLNPRRDQITVTIRDEGKGFNPALGPSGEGFGLILIYQFMDEVRYNRKGNEVKMIKRRGGQD